MANPEHVELVRKGALAIAKWQLAHHKEILDLREADLSGADLSEATLRDANLAGARLKGATLRGSNLIEADLVGANLTGAHLERTTLIHADLSEANISRAHLEKANAGRALFNHADLSDAYLSKTSLFAASLAWAKLKRAHLARASLLRADLFAADLSDTNACAADLRAANLTEATLNGADLSRSRLGSTSLGDVDLSQVRGLATVDQESPSSVGVDTLVASFRGAGNKFTLDLRTFFRRAGVPQELLDALPHIVREVEYYSCFISYGQPNLEFAKKLCQDLETKGVSCWLYEMDKTPGERTWSEIGARRREADKMVALCSAAALIRPGVRKEIEEQIDEDESKLIPISLDDLWREKGFPAERDGRDLKPSLLGRNYVDFANKPYEEALEELLKGLRRP
ncbi:MAG: toll/interleukin-1 receptor domain-containing protein, partial [Dehalococcoidia bacterium]